MADSTHLQPATQATPPDDHRPALPGRADPCSPGARHAIVDLVADDVRGYVDSILEEEARLGSIRGDHQSPEMRDLVDTLVDVVLTAARSGRLPSDVDLIPFEVLGVRCGGAASDFTDAIAILDSAAEAIRENMVVRGHQIDGLYDEKTVDEAVASLCGVVEVISRDAHAALVRGQETVLDSVHFEPAVLVRAGELRRNRGALYYPACLRFVDDRATWSVCVLYGSGEDSFDRVAAAIAEAQVLLRFSVATLVDERRHGLLILSGTSKSEWQHSDAILRDLGRWHRLEVRASSPAPMKPDLRDVYLELAQSIPAGGDTPWPPGQTTSLPASA